LDRLTGRQAAILEFIQQSLRDHGYPPSVREIGEAVGLASSSTVHGHLARLEAKGYLRRDPSKPRAIEVFASDVSVAGALASHEHAVMAPIIGKVTAGLPITAVENIEDYFPVPKSMAKGYEVFLLRVQGDSMIEAGIFDGDFVIVRKQDSARNGDIVVAMTEADEATIKRFFMESDTIRLQPENSSMKPLYYRNVRVLGLVVGVFRDLQ